VTPQKLKASLKVAIKARRPVMIWGSPGVGKSAIVKQVADDLGIPVQDERVADRDPVDFRGLPHIKDGMTYWTLPGFLPREGKGILFLDELSAAPPSVQAVLYQLVLDRKLGNYRLPDGWEILAAGNLESDRAVVFKMSSALSNKLIHLTFDVSLDDFVEWGLGAGIRPEVIAFVRFRPELLHSFDPSKGERSFPTPRTWEFVSDLMNADGEGSEADLIKGAVGEGAGVEFLGFLRTARELPDLDSILKDPEGSLLPKNPGAIYAVCSGLSRKVSAANMAAAMAYVSRMAEEFQALFIKDSLKLKPEIQSTKPFIDWAVKNSWILKG